MFESNHLRGITTHQYWKTFLCFPRTLTGKLITMQANSSTAVLCWGYSSSTLCLSYLDFPYFHSVSVLNTRTPQSGRHEYTDARRHTGARRHTHAAARHLEGIKQLRHWLDTPEPRREGGIDSRGGGRRGKQGIVDGVGVCGVSKSMLGKERTEEWVEKNRHQGWKKIS